MWIKWHKLNSRILSRGVKTLTQREVSLTVFWLVLMFRFYPLLVEIFGKFQYLENYLPFKAITAFKTENHLNIYIFRYYLTDNTVRRYCKVKKIMFREIVAVYCGNGSRDSVEGIATLYALGCLGFEPRWGQEILLSPHPSSAPPSSCTMRIISFPRVKRVVRGVEIKHG
jgi:hypothetical protein